MALAMKPATASRFDDLEALLGPKRSPDAAACWCLPYRLGYADSAKVPAAERRARARELVAHRPAPGLIGFDGDEPVGWVSLGRRSEFAELAGDAYPPAEGDPWAIVCIRVRGGKRRRGIGRALLHGALGYLRSRGGGPVEAYPVDPDGAIAPVLAHPGLRAMFAREGFEPAGAVVVPSSSPPRIVMRRRL